MEHAPDVIRWSSLSLFFLWNCPGSNTPPESRGGLAMLAFRQCPVGRQSCSDKKGDFCV